MTCKRLLAAFATLVVLALHGCGGEEPSDSGTSERALPSTARPELAFFTTHPEGSEGVYDVALGDDQGEDRVILTGGSREGTVWPQLFTRLSWSPDGERLAFAGGPGPLDATPEDRTDIYVIDANGSNLEQVTEVGDARDPVWSPDADTIVFGRSQFREGGPLRGHLWSIRSDGSALTELAAADPWEGYSAGSFSPDGSRLAVTRGTFDPETGGSSASIYIMNPDGSQATELMHDAASPAFSPDGERIAFVSDRDRNGELCYGDRCFAAAELYVANADGSDPERLTQSEARNEASPSWLIDGSRIVFQRGEEFQNAEVMSILELNANGSCVREILRGSGRGAWYASPALRPSEPRDGAGPLGCQGNPR